MNMNRVTPGGGLQARTARRALPTIAFAANVKAPAKASITHHKPLFSGAVFRARLDVQKLGLHPPLKGRDADSSAADCNDSSSLLCIDQSSIDLDGFIQTTSATPIAPDMLSPRTMASRDKVIKTICSVSRPEGGLLEVLADSDAVADIAGLLLLLVQAGQHDQVTELGEAFLSAHVRTLKSREPQLSKDLALIVAWAHAAQAEAHLTAQGQPQAEGLLSAEAEVHPGAAAAHAHAAAALALVKRLSVPLPGDVYMKWERMEKALAPLRALSLLSQYAHSSTLHTDAPGGGGSSTGQQDAKSAAAHAAGQRAQGLQMLKAAMWGCGDAERLELVGRARPNLTAAELISLYEGAPAPPNLFSSKHGDAAAGAASPSITLPHLPRTGTAPTSHPQSPSQQPTSLHAHPQQLLEQELYDLAMAHIAEGVTRRWPQSIWRAEHLLGLVAEQGVGVDVSLELSVCALLTGRPPATPYGHANATIDLSETEDEEEGGGRGPVPKVSFGARAQQGQGASHGHGHSHSAVLLSLGSDAQVLLAENGGPGRDAEAAMTRWAESWIKLSVFSSFPEKAGQEVSLEAWFKNPTVALMNQMGKVGALAGMSAEVAGGAASSLLTGLSGLVGKAPGWPPSVGLHASTQQPAGPALAGAGAAERSGAGAAVDASAGPAAASNNIVPAMQNHKGLDFFSSRQSPAPPTSPPTTQDLPPSAAVAPGAGATHRPVASAQQLAQALANSSLSVDEFTAAAAAQQSLWLSDESGHIRPRMRARIVDPTGLPTTRAPTGPWWTALGISSHALVGVVIAMLCFVNRHRIMDVATRSGYLPALPQTAVVIPHTADDLLRGVEEAQRAAGGAYLSESGAQRLLQQWLVTRGAALGGVAHTKAALPQLLSGPELKALRREVSHMDGSGQVLRLTHGVVHVVGVEAGRAGRTATVTARVCEQGNVLTSDEVARVAAGKGSPLHLGAHHSSTHTVRVALRLERSSRQEPQLVWKVWEVARTEMEFPQPLLDD